MSNIFLRVFVMVPCWVLSFISCRRDAGQMQAQEKLAQRLLISDPDSALRVIDQALLVYSDDRRSDAVHIRLLLLRQQIFAGRQQMDSVISTGKSIRKLALLQGDSLSMARSLLPVRGEISPEDQRDLEPLLPGAVRAFADKNMRYEEAVIEGLSGAIATRKGQFAAAMPHLYRARDIHEGLDSVKPLYAVYMNIGNSLSGMGDLRGSLPFYDKARQVAFRLNDSIRVATSLMNKGIVMSDLRIFDSSKISLNEGLKMLPSKGGAYARLQMKYNLATVQFREKDFTAAEVEFRAVVSEARELGDPYAMVMAKSGLASVLGGSGRPGEAIPILESTLRQTEEAGMGYYTSKILQNLVEVYEQTGRYQQAFVSLERLKKLGDSSMALDKQKAVSELVMKYDFEQQEEEKVVLQEKLRQRNLMATMLIVAVIGLSVLGFVFRQRNIYHRELNQTYSRLLDSYRSKRDRPDAGLLPPVMLSKPGSLYKDLIQEGDAASAVDSPVQAGAGPTEEDIELHDKILHYFHTEKPYLNADMKLEDVSSRFEVSSRRITEAIRAVTGQGYSDYVNRFRIAEATRIMDTTDARQHKLEFIAAQCGFSSRQYFRRVFEQVTGVNPSFYRRQASGSAEV